MKYANKFTCQLTDDGKQYALACYEHGIYKKAGAAAGCEMCHRLLGMREEVNRAVLAWSRANHWRRAYWYEAFERGRYALVQQVIEANTGAPVTREPPVRRGIWETEEDWND